MVWCFVPCCLPEFLCTFELSYFFGRILTTFEASIFGGGLFRWSHLLIHSVECSNIFSRNGWSRLITFLLNIQKDQRSSSRHNMDQQIDCKKISEKKNKAKLPHPVYAWLTALRCVFYYVPWLEPTKVRNKKSNAMR